MGKTFICLVAVGRAREWNLCQATATPGRSLLLMEDPDDAAFKQLLFGDSMDLFAVALQKHSLFLLLA